MADINIVQQHKLTAVKAREAAQQVADKLAQDNDPGERWLRSRIQMFFGDPDSL